MATKKIKKEGEYTFTIKLKTKDTTYIFKDEDVARATILKFDTMGYADNYTKNNDDLLIRSQFVDAKTGGYKVVLTTIKDYYKYYPKNANIVKINDEKPDISDIPTYITKSTEDVAAGIDVVGDKGKTKYILKNVTATAMSGNEDYVEDLGGNDTYFIATNYNDPVKYPKVYVTDWSGKDNYTITNGDSTNPGSYFNIEDMSGNDAYSIRNINASERSLIFEEKGNDKYQIIDSGNISITDTKGKDTYTIKAGSDMTIDDSNGNDKYNVSSSTSGLIIKDGDPDIGTGGNDSYIISDIKKLRLSDGAGNDKYNFNNVSNQGVDTNQYYVEDFSGNDKYKLIVSDNLLLKDNKGNDIWAVSKSNNLTIIDSSEGKDTYSLIDSSNLTITDKGGNDKYTLNKITNEKSLYITDENGDDKYNVTSSSVNIRDYEGKDVYTVKNSQKTTIYDFNSDSKDTYKINKLNGATIITDGGGNDTLSIGLNAKSVIYMANFYKDGKGVTDGTLYLLDKTKTGYAQLNFYFKTKTDGAMTIFDTSESGSGRIETVKAGTKKITSGIDNFASDENIKALSATVAGWLTNNGFASVNTLLTDGSDQQITDFITFVQG